MKAVNIAIVLFVLLAGLSAVADEPKKGTDVTPLAYWPMASCVDKSFPDSSGKYILTADGEVKVVDDKRFGKSALFGGQLVFSSELIKELQKTGTVTLAFWLFTDHKAGDATSQPFLVIDNGKGQVVQFNLRWNRFQVLHGRKFKMDTRPAGYEESTILDDYWTYVVLNWSEQKASIIVGNNLVGEVVIPEQNPGFKGGITIGSKAFGGKIAHLRVFDRVITVEQAQAFAKLNTPQDVPGEDDPVPNCPGETLGMKKREGEYSIKELKQYFIPLEQWPQWKAMTRLSDSYAKDRFKNHSEPYVHPRVLFNADELPAIRKRIKQSASGRRMMGGIRGRCMQFHPDRQIWEKHFDRVNLKDYRQQYEEQNITVGGGRFGYHGPWLGGWLNTLADGEVSDAMKEDFDIENAAQRTFRYLIYGLPYDTFRALIDEDEEALKRNGKAVAILSRFLAQHPDILKMSKDRSWGMLYQRIGGQSIGLVYDMAYNYMSKKDRDDTRKFISMVTAGKDIMRYQNLPALPANTTNWIGMSTTMLPMILSIYGEEGFDPMALERIVESQKKWVYVANGPLGAPFEGFSKSGYMPWWLIYLARSGHDFIGSEYSKNVYRKFCLHTMVPWGGRFIYETGITPIDLGIPYMKHAHPEDSVIDMLFARHYLDKQESYWPGTRSTYSPLYLNLVLLDEPVGYNDETYDWSKMFDATMAQLKQEKEPLSYYSDYRGVMTARSDWDKDAIMFYMEPRNVAGGHTHGSRNEFLVVGLGREWSTRHYSVEAPSQWHSVILIDGKGQGQELGKTPPGRTLGFTDNKTASFLTGDASWAYSYGLVNKIDLGDPISFSPNDSRLEKSSLPLMNAPWSVLPQWLTSGKPSRKNGVGHSHWAPYNKVEYAFRTGGLVRGKYPYALVVDDIKKDDKSHKYTWQMQLANDLNVEKKYADGILDLNLVEEGPRRCLVRCVEAGGKAVDKTTAETSGHDPFKFTNRYKKTVQNNRMTINTKAETGAFKTLVYPYRPGMPEMQTSWNADRSKLTVNIGEQKDVFSFSKMPDGMTKVSLNRNGKEVF